ncbi:MAG: GIY-YIG nuclease family protein [Thiotrichales bacterium]|nr:GIY-YIG nuclease family protein [Thiotrichales bacterium]
MGLGKTIRIYLNDGSVSGIRHAEIVNWTGQAITSPRSKIKNLASWDESNKPGVYFLFGVDKESGDDAVYIGEAENVFSRLQNHITKKDFWNEVVFFTSKDENLTKSHVKYLESKLVQLAKLSARHVVLNGNEPQRPVLPRGDRDAMDEFIANLIILLGAVGYKTLESIDKAKPTLICEQDSQVIEVPNTDILELFLKVKGIDAQANVTDEGIVVLANSHASKTVNKSLSAGYAKLRNQLVQNGTLIEMDGILLFTKNQLFKSPSQAAAIIVGYSVNGLNQWKTKDGFTLKSVEESNTQNI